tara:strand:+ start:2242 stop:3408 length:1167 start_codon:yes stop_codon:yes gene_type:complete
MIYPELIFNHKIFEGLVNAHLANRLPHALIFHGNNGIGKEAHAIEFAAFLNCISDGRRACGRCSNCIRISSFQHGNVKLVVAMPASNKSTNIEGGSVHTLSSTHLKSFMSSLEEKGKDPYYKVNLNSNSIPINIVRELRKDLYMSSIEGGWRIVIIFDAEKLCTGTQASANALLKILEEPPEKSLFILVTSYQNQLLDTIKSRCQSFYFRNPSIKKIKTYLQKKNIDDEKCDILAKISHGNLGLALELFKNYDYIIKDIKIIFEVFFNKNYSFYKKFQSRLQDLNRTGNRELFDNFFQLQSQLIRDLILMKIDRQSEKIVFSNLKTKYLKIIDDNPNADFHSMLEVIDDAYRMHKGNVNLTINAISLIFDIESCLKGNEYQGIDVLKY